MTDYKRKGITISGPTDSFYPSAFGGSDELFALVTVVNSRNIPVVDFDDGHSEMTGLTNQAKFTKPMVVDLITKGLEVFGYPIVFSVNLESEVLADFPERLDSEGNPKTWQQWADDNGRTPIEKDGKQWLTLRQNPAGSQWVAWSNAGLEIISLHEFQNLAEV